MPCGQGDAADGKGDPDRLLKTDQSNASYWIWMSAAVDTTKERIYCLETALRLDPQNAIAKRGLVLLGGRHRMRISSRFRLTVLAPGKRIFCSRTRSRRKRASATMSSPQGAPGRPGPGRGVGMGVAGYCCFFNPRATSYSAPSQAGTAGPSPTFTFTPTFVNATARSLQRERADPAGGSERRALHADCALVNTPRSPLSSDIYRSAKAAFDQGNLGCIRPADAGGSESGARRRGCTLLHRRGLSPQGRLPARR